MALFEDVVAAHRRDGNAVGIGMVLLNIGRVHHELGDHPASRLAFEEARASFEEVGFRSHIAYALQGLAAAEASEKRFEQAARLLGRARRELDDVGSPERGSAPAMVSWVTAQAQGALGHEAFDAAYAEGGQRNAEYQSDQNNNNCSGSARPASDSTDASRTPGSEPSQRIPHPRRG